MEDAEDSTESPLVLHYRAKRRNIPVRVHLSAVPLMSTADKNPMRIVNARVAVKTVTLGVDRAASLAIIGAAALARQERILARMARHYDPYVRGVVSRHRFNDKFNEPHIALAFDADPTIRRGLASADTALSGTVLALLATDREPSVREAVARRTRPIPTAIVTVLIDDPSLAVRVALARNPGTQHWALLRLASDTSRQVRGYASANPNADDAVRVTAGLSGPQE